MPINLFPHQKLAVSQLKTGSILCGGVGSGKSLTALVYFYTVECKTNLYDTIKEPKDLYIITTAKKRDTLEWERECGFLMLSTKRENSISGIQVVVDSWNNIHKYQKVKNAFFIFDEQRVVGSGAWVKSFIKISKENNWILLSATPGDTWMDYVPVFVANNFYKNRTDFIRSHVVYNSFTKFPKIDHYVETKKLVNLRNSIMVNMVYQKAIVRMKINLIADYDLSKFDQIFSKRWNIFENRPIKDVSEYCFTMRRLVNSDNSRLFLVKGLLKEHKKMIIFYNFNYELEKLKKLSKIIGVVVAEHNGHKHEEVPDSDSWVYLVQYNSGAEGWNCVKTNTVVFYSQNYSYRMMTQAAGRIDRMNTPFEVLYYYNIISNSKIDLAISKALKNKKDFNEKTLLSR